MTKTMRRIIAIISILFCVILCLLIIKGTDMIVGLPFAVATMSLATIVRLHP